MTSHRRQRYRSCTRKRRYADRAEALAAMHMLIDWYRMNAYRCKFCHRWHIGHKRKQDRMAAEKRRGRG